MKIRHLFTLVAMMFILTACDRPPSGFAIYRAAFLRVTHDDAKKPLSIAIAFPKCAHTAGFGAEGCRKLLCNVVVENRTRNKELERTVCHDAETDLIPMLMRVRTEEGCEKALSLYALQLVEAHEISLESLKENGGIEPRIKFLPRSIRESYGDSTAPSQELRTVWSL